MSEAARIRVGMLVSSQAQMLDVAGPLDVLAEAALQAGRPDAYQFELISADGAPVRASNGMLFHADCSIEDSAGGFDTLLVAGSPAMPMHEGDTRVSAWLRRQASQVRRIGSVCTGAFLLADAGLLDGKRVTTHWNSSSRLARQFPQVRVQADQIYIKHGKLYTSAGVTAGLDLALALAEEDFGRAVALKVARQMVMFFKRPGGQAQFSSHLAAQEAERSAIRDVQAWALDNLGQTLGVNELAVHAGMSVRNFARLFKDESESTPADFVELARIEAARRMLEDSATPLKRVAALAGFSDPNGMRRAFMRRLGVSPADYRSRFHDGGTKGG